MTRIIKNRAVVEDNWSVLRLVEGETAETVALPQSPTLLPLAVWLARKGELQTTQVGVWLAAGEGPEEIADDLGQLAETVIDDEVDHRDEKERLHRVAIKLDGRAGNAAVEQEIENRRVERVAVVLLVLSHIDRNLFSGS